MYQVFKSTPSIFNLQKCFFSTDIPAEHYGRFVFLTSSKSKYFVKICFKPFLAKGTCLLDGSVRCNVDQDLFTQETLVYNDLTFVNSIKLIKTLHIDLIFKSIWDQNEWSNKSVHFLAILKHFLEIFVLAPEVVICVKDIDQISKLGIHSIVIKNIGNIAAGKVVKSSKLLLDSLTSYDRFVLKKAEPLPIYGLNSEMNSLKKLLTTYKKCSHLDSPAISLKVLVLGADGAGKKSLVKSIATECGSVLITIDGPELNRSEPGETERLLKKKFDEAYLHSKEGLTIILLLRLESICGKEGRISSQLLHLLDNTPLGLAVIATTSKPHLLNQSYSLSSRFNYRIFLGIPTEAERAEMIAGLVGGILTKKATMELAEKTPGFVAADLKLLVARARRECHTNSNSNPSEDSLCAALHKCVYQMEGSAVRGELGLVRGEKLDLEELGGLTNVKSVLVQSVIWPLTHPESFKRFNIPKPSGVLLYGPPGCAKTCLARAVASCSNLTFLSVSAADLLSPYVGDAELTLTSLFQRARDASPTLIFVDEIDALVGNREDKQRGAHERLLSTFLIEMDGIGVRAESTSRQVLEAQVTVIGATNRPDCIDPALLRPGRLDRLLYVPPPDLDSRFEILKLITKHIPLADCVDLFFIAEHTELYSGADLKHLCQEAGFHAFSMGGMDITVVRQEHFLAALRDTSPSLSPCQINFYENFAFS